MNRKRFKGRSYVAGRAAPRRSRPRRLYVNQGELQGVDTILTVANGSLSSTTSSNASAFTLNLVPPGNGSYARKGRKIKNVSVRIKGTGAYHYAHTAVTGNLTANTMRMVVVWDKQATTTVPVFSDIFGTTLQDGTEATAVLDSLRYDNTGRFSVLRDFIIAKSPQVSNEQGGSTDVTTCNFIFDEFIQLKNRTTIFKGMSDPATIADISSGALYVYFRATANVVSENAYEIAPSSYARLRFTDL